MCVCVCVCVPSTLANAIQYVLVVVVDSIKTASGKSIDVIVINNTSLKVNTLDEATMLELDQAIIKV